MKKISICIFALILIFLTSSPISCADTTTQPTTINVLIDGEEVQLKSIVNNGQLFIAIDELAPAIGFSLNTTELNKTTLTSITDIDTAITKAKIDFSTSIISNNSVGNEWNYYIKSENTTYYSYQQGSEIILDGTDLNIELVVYEHDDGKSDYGFDSISVPYVEIMKGQTLTFSKMITVTENGGRYSGNTATIQFNLIITPM